MYTLCVTEKTESQQRRFEMSLLDTMKNQPYSSITVIDLCRSVGLSRKVFYRLFYNKNDVLYALIDHTIADFISFDVETRELSPDLPEEPQRFFYYWKSQKELLDILGQNQMTALLLERCINHVMANQKDMRQYFGADQGAHGREVMLFFLSGIMSLVINWHQTGYANSVSEMTQLLCELLINPPVKAAKPR